MHALLIRNNQLMTWQSQGKASPSTKCDGFCPPAVPLQNMEGQKKHQKFKVNSDYLVLSRLASKTLSQLRSLEKIILTILNNHRAWPD